MKKQTLSRHRQTFSFSSRLVAAQLSYFIALNRRAEIRIWNFVSVSSLILKTSFTSRHFYFFPRGHFRWFFSRCCSVVVVCVCVRATLIGTLVRSVRTSIFKCRKRVCRTHETEPVEHLCSERKLPAHRMGCDVCSFA